MISEVEILLLVLIHSATWPEQSLVRFILLQIKLVLKISFSEFNESITNGLASAIKDEYL